MMRRRLHAAWLAGVSGAMFPYLLVAAWTAVSMHEGWARVPKILVQPLLLGFVAAVISGFWLAPRVPNRCNRVSDIRG